MVDRELAAGNAFKDHFVITQKYYWYQMALAVPGNMYLLLLSYQISCLSIFSEICKTHIQNTPFEITPHCHSMPFCNIFGHFCI